MKPLPMGTWHDVVDANVARHDLVATSSRDGVLFQCRQGCGRQMLVNRASGGLTILTRGDPLAVHAGAIGGIELQVGLIQP
jgi:hypothetical protein